MKTSILILALTALVGTAGAQLATLPPSSTTDGIVVKLKGMNSGSTHWDSPTTLGGYTTISSTSGDAPFSSPLYNPAGLAFSAMAPAAVQADMAAINANGGTIRTIFVAESAGWQNDFGYTYSGKAAGPNSFTVWQNIQVDPSPATIAFGSYFDVPLAIGQASTFDLWLNGVGDYGLTNPPTPTENGGVYVAFSPANSDPYVSTGNARWAQSALSVNTFLPTSGTYGNISTYLLGIGDWRLDRGADRDFTDIVVAVQFFDSTGQPFGGTPVPEASTYGLFGALALAGLASVRRFRRIGRT